MLGWGCPAQHLSRTSDNREIRLFLTRTFAPSLPAPCRCPASYPGRESKERGKGSAEHGGRSTARTGPGPAQVKEHPRSRSHPHPNPQGASAFTTVALHCDNKRSNSKLPLFNKSRLGVRLLSAPATVPL